ncbi:MAG TPA: hypothetical protein PK307_05405, partial [Spirochaetota bacterium]|nr:hypothetical protein [Spirochaetota bacterium]
RLGMIRSWDSYKNPVIIDNMMNLELLMWAAKHGGEKRFADIAISHADQTNARHFRPDNSAYHIVDYNPLTGKIFGYYAGQGASADGPWARGQSWGLYGFTMMYRETRKPEYLARAVKSADFLVRHRNLPADAVPYWDYEAADIPNAPRDEIAGYREGIGKGTVHPRDVKVILAKNICAQFYDQETAERAAGEFTRVFSNKEVPDDVPEFHVPDGEKTGGSIWIVKLMVLAGTAATNGEARRLIKGGGVTFNNEKISAEDYELPLPAEGILKVGKRKFVKIIG